MGDKSSNDSIEMWLKYLLAIELWRGGLTQGVIGTRLRVSKATVNDWLKGVSREVVVAAKAGK